MPNFPVLVAHRGYPAKYPENTLISMEAALQAGAQAVEFDVQLTSDGVPVLFHDHELHRMTGTDGLVTSRSLYELRALRAYEPERFGKQFYDISISTLQDIVELLSNWPKVEVFVEVKTESMDVFGREAVLKAVTKVIKPIAHQCVLISFDHDILALSRQNPFKEVIKKIAWVLHKYDEMHYKKATELKPDLLICNMKKIADDIPLWKGHWQWMLYETGDVSKVKHCFQKGAAYVETDNIGKLLQELQKEVI